MMQSTSFWNSACLDRSESSDASSRDTLSCEGTLSQRAHSRMGGHDAHTLKEAKADVGSDDTLALMERKRALTR